MSKFRSIIGNLITFCILRQWSNKGPSINDVMAIGGRGYQGFCDNSIKALLLKSVTTGGRGVKKLSKNCVTLFMDDP